MITLITGAPGAGKTAALVKLLSQLAKGRAIFVDGIPELKVPHEPLMDATKWPELVPDGSAVVIDEVQRVWRPAGPGQRIPDSIQLLETHRHRGLDFYIVTQHPKLIHTNVRNLVGRHVHLRDIGVLGRWWYEWPEAVDPSSWRTAPVKLRYRLPKAHLALYKSATEHIKPVRKIPPVVYVLALAVPLTIWLAWVVYGKISGKMTKPVQEVAQKAAVPTTGKLLGGSGGPAAPAALWPKLRSDPVAPATREPYIDRAFQLEGEWTIGGQAHALFGVLVDGKRVATASLAQLLKAGYSWTTFGPCAGALRFGEVERLVTCAPAIAVAAAAVAALPPPPQATSP